MSDKVLINKLHCTISENLNEPKDYFPTKEITRQYIERLKIIYSSLICYLDIYSQKVRKDILKAFRSNGREY